MVFCSQTMAVWVFRQICQFQDLGLAACHKHCPFTHTSPVRRSCGTMQCLLGYHMMSSRLGSTLFWVSSNWLKRWINRNLFQMRNFSTKDKGSSFVDRHSSFETEWRSAEKVISGLCYHSFSRGIDSWWANCWNWPIAQSWDLGYFEGNSHHG